MRQSALRNRLIDTIRSNQQEFRGTLSDLIDAGHLDDINQEILQDNVDNIRSKSSENASAREMMLRWRLQVLDNIQFGLTLTGPAYEDNPIRYANQTFRETTGYTLSQLRGSNPRILQGPMTEASAINALREATQIWEPVTVTLWNYRYNGVPFRTRLSITPLRRDDGMITHWLGVQSVIDSLTELSKPESEAVGKRMSKRRFDLNSEIIGKYKLE
ncbi:PAS domain-containing protein [Haloquadratum walsbyi]|jgi:PAS domain S-box-containing protein|uniref:Sensor box protein n=1 Tax=Haloquadratum walsbyi (strain DSM 16790 / HBSQ001) TaxID=362976 RepID=Q18J96_HALWD|nr:PAS domain-containing protein [Haloquadratum walsbyi]CAJ51915.1 sensor box protein [Haloquadratum walsbyi DSM 16790]